MNRKPKFRPPVYSTTSDCDWMEKFSFPFRFYPLIWENLAQKSSTHIHIFVISCLLLFDPAGVCPPFTLHSHIVQYSPLIYCSSYISNYTFRLTARDTLIPPSSVHHPSIRVLSSMSIFFVTAASGNRYFPPLLCLTVLKFQKTQTNATKTKELSPMCKL